MTEKHQTENKKIDDDKKYYVPSKWCDHFESSIIKESLRAQIVLSGCYLDEALYDLLKIVLVPEKSKNDVLFDGPQAPLGTFSSKIEIAYRLQLIDKETKESIHLIRKIRNEFSHNLMKCDFSNTKILDYNKKLYSIFKDAMKEGRKKFEEGEVGNFLAVVSLVLFIIRSKIQEIPVTCPCCGEIMPYREKIKHQIPEENLS